MNIHEESANSPAQHVSPSCHGESGVACHIDGEFLRKVLAPYRDNCVYLKKAAFESGAQQGIQSAVLSGEFGIPESCYIDETGHFNAVEFNICYNQFAYVFLAHVIKHRLIPELNDYDIDTFFAKQLPNCLILNLNSRYRSVLDSKRFYGVFGVSSVKKRANYTVIKTHCAFHDDAKGKSSGEVTLAILSPTGPQ